MKKTFSCRQIAAGKVRGEVLTCTDQILFYHTDPKTGVVTEVGHALEGVSVKDKILVFPGGKGSSVVQMDGLYKLELNGAAPLGFIVHEPDTVLVSTAIIMEIPMVDRVEDEFYNAVKTGDQIEINASEELAAVTMLKNYERTSSMDTLILNGHDLTLQDVYDVAYDGRKVEIAADAYARLAKGREIMQELSKGGKAIYGFNRGVGQNKDVTIDEDFMETQNRMMLRSHSLGLPPFNTDEEVRAMMVIRLNNMLIGASCASDDLANSYRDFLNHGITPRIPRRGAVGEADITTITHIGLAFIGEEDVNYKGKVVSAKEAMDKEGLKPLHLQLKDTHTIMLSNSQGEGTAAILVHEVENLVKMSDRIFCLDYEGLNGNIEPMREDVNELRGLPGQIRCAARCRKDLEGSYLYSDNRPEHALQDPLTFRGGFIITGAVEDALDYVKKFLSIQINSPSDNPCIMLDKKDVFVNSNFETTSLVIGVEMLAIALAHLSRAVNYRLIRMCMPEFTHLPRFLAPRNGSAHGYDEVQNVLSCLDAENRYLTTPSSVDFYPMQGSIEDHASNLPLAVTKCRQMVDNLRYLVGMEALFASQAVDLRKSDDNGDYVHLGKGTQKAYDVLRAVVPEMKSNRSVYDDINKAYQLVLEEKFLADGE